MLNIQCHLILPRLTSTAMTITAVLFLEFGATFGNDCMAMPRLWSGGRSNHLGSRIPSKQSLPSGYIVLLPSQRITGEFCSKIKTRQLQNYLTLKIMMINSFSVNFFNIYYYSNFFLSQCYVEKYFIRMINKYEERALKLGKTLRQNNMLH